MDRDMARFYFHVLDGSALSDDTGLELPGIDAAKIAAVRLAGAVIRDGIPDEVWKGSPWRVVVSDSPLPTAGGGAHFPDPDLVGPSASCPSCLRLSRAGL